MTTSNAIPILVPCIVRDKTLLLVQNTILAPLDKWGPPDTLVAKSLAVDYQIRTYLLTNMHILVAILPLVRVQNFSVTTPQGTVGYLGLYYHCKIQRGLSNLKNQRVRWVPLVELDKYPTPTGVKEAFARILKI